MSPAQGNEPLGNQAQMQRKPKILKSWTVSFLLRFVWVWVCFQRQDAREYTIIAVANQAETLISTGSLFSLLYVNEDFHKGIVYQDICEMETFCHFSRKLFKKIWL